MRRCNRLIVQRHAEQCALLLQDSDNLEGNAFDFYIASDRVQSAEQLFGSFGSKNHDRNAHAVFRCGKHPAALDLVIVNTEEVDGYALEPNVVDFCTVG